MFKKGISPDIVTYNTLINGHCREGKLVEAFRLHSKMSSNGVLPDHISYALVIRGLYLHGNVCRAHQLLHKMLDDSILPDPLLWNLVIDGYGRCGETELVFEVRDHLLALSMAPNIFTYNAAHVKEGNLQGAFMLKEEMFENGILPDVVTYNLLITHELLVKMKNMDVPVDHVPHPILIRKYCKEKQLDIAFDLYEEMFEKGLRSKACTYHTLITELTKNGFFKEALQVNHNMGIESAI
ncbi:hypothetical protein AMTR_s00158p00090260 [Amborella trichopoda]|uniref:Pentacotripeptide-repeat region of PRORP domain-containing protein n=1 Tax=Amborella trichopoda TaxID=13333 RepID=W1PSE1_AMBTC|nr:hypothetical protein AMTR_s00158p00090260 [Amborella trichopoda]